MRTSSAISICVSAVLGLSASAQVQYDFETFNFGDNSYTVATDMSSDGRTVVGYYHDSTGFHGFIRTDGVVTKFDAPAAGGYTAIHGINSNGVMVGCWKEGGWGDRSHGFTLESGQFTTLDYPGAYHTCATDISDAGQIVGYSSSDPDNTDFWGFVWYGGSWTAVRHSADRTALNGISPNGLYIVGQAECNGGWIGFLYQDGTFTDIIYPESQPGSITAAQAADSNGLVVGSSSFIDASFTYQSGNFLAIVQYFGESTGSEGMNDAGQIAGYYWNGSGDTGYVATPRHYAAQFSYDSTRPVRGGRAMPLKIQILALDATGTNVSSPDLVVHATVIQKISEAVSLEVADTGNANPDNDFRYDAGLSGYLFNLSTKSLSTGTYCLRFTIGDEAAPSYCAPFQVK